MEQVPDDTPEAEEGHGRECEAEEVPQLGVCP